MCVCVCVCVLIFYSRRNGCSAMGSVALIVSCLFPAVDHILGGGSLGVDLDDSFEDNVERAGSRLFSQIILSASNKVMGFAAHDQMFRLLPRKMRKVVSDSTASVVSVIDQVASDTLQWSAVDGVVVLNPCFLHTVHSAVVWAHPGSMEKVRKMTISLVSEQCKVLKSAMLAAEADTRLHSATTAAVDGELLRPAKVLCSSLVRSHLRRKGSRGRARAIQWILLNKEPLMQPECVAATPAETLCFQTALPFAAASAAKRRRKGRAGVSHRMRFSRGVPEPVVQTDWSALMREAAIREVQAILSEIIVECRSLEEDVRKIRRHRWVLRLIFNHHHIRVVWPSSPSAGFDAADSVEQKSTANPAEARDPVCESDSNGMVELVIYVPNTLLLLSLCRRVPQFSSFLSKHNKASDGVCAAVHSRGSNDSAVQDMANCFVFQSAQNDCISDLVALICQKTGLYPTDFYVASEGHRLLPSYSVSHCCLSSGSALHCHPVKNGGGRKKQGASAQRAMQHGVQTPTAGAGAAAAASGGTGPVQSRAGSAHKFFPVITNQGNECFINSAFQLLLPAFDSVEARRILRLPHQAGSAPIVRLLSDCFLALVSQSTASSSPLWSEVAKKMVLLKQMLGKLIPKHSIGEQNDPADVIRIILDKLPWFGNMFKYSVITNSQCTGPCQMVYLQPPIVDTGLNITVEFRQEVGAAVSQLFQATLVHEVDCANCKCKTSKIEKPVLNSLPAFLLVFIKVHGVVRGQVEQQELREFRSLNLANILNPEWQNMNADYTLISGVMHVGGSVSEGHYLAQHCYPDPRMDVVISDARSWPSKGLQEAHELQLQHSGRVLLYRRDAAAGTASAGAGSESVGGIPAAIPSALSSGQGGLGCPSQAATQRLSRGQPVAAVASAAATKDSTVSRGVEPFFSSIAQMVQHARGLGCTRSPASMLNFSAVDVSFTPMNRFIIPGIAYACMLGDEFFLPLPTEREMLASGMTSNPVLLVKIVQSCIMDGTLRVHLIDFVVQQNGLSRFLSFSNDLIAGTLCFINAHSECKGVLMSISVEVHAHFKGLQQRQNQEAKEQELELLRRQDLFLSQQEESRKYQRLLEQQREDGRVRQCLEQQQQ